LQALSSQSNAFAKQLKRQSAADDGDDASDGSDDEDEDEDDDVQGGDDDGGESANSAGEVAWDSLVDQIKTAEATAANLRASRVSLQNRGAGSSSAEPTDGNASAKRCAIPMLPLNLLIFVIAPLLLAPFYIAIYSTSVTAIDSVVAAQVCLNYAYIRALFRFS
jgi:hypothetical protein